MTQNDPGSSDPGTWPSVLANTTVLAGLPEPVLREVARACHPRTLDKGEVLFEEGDASGFVAVVASGLLDSFKRNDAGEPVWLRSLCPGDTAGLTSFGEGKARSA